MLPRSGLRSGQPVPRYVLRIGQHASTCEQGQRSAGAHPEGCRVSSWLGPHYVWCQVVGLYPEEDRLTSGTFDENELYSVLAWRSAMKTLVVYDSLYGNTKSVAQAIGDAIPGEVGVTHVGDVNLSSLPGYDLVIVGAPTHGAKPSPDLQGFLDQIQASALQGVKVAGFDTRMTNRLITMFGTAAPKIAKALQGKGGTLVGKPAGFFVTGGKGPLKDGEVERAAAWAQGLVGNQA